MACVYVYVIALTFLGPEYLGRDFHVENDEDMAAAAGGKIQGMHSDAFERESGSSNHIQEKVSRDGTDHIEKV